MSERHSTDAAPRSKPAKPLPDFPLFPHATGRWAKKVGGKLHYFGPWKDPDGALRRYEAFVRTGTVQPSARAPKPRKRRGDATHTEAPPRPYPEFPLFPHATRRWAKKIRGQLHYFGPWNDPDGALDKYLREKDDLHAGRRPRPDADEIEVVDVANAFLIEKKAAVSSGELSSRTFDDYEDTCDLIVAHFGKGRVASDVRQEEFAALRKKLSKKWGPHRLGKAIQCIRCVFKFAYDSELIEKPVTYGPGFKRPSKKTLRLHKAAQGPKLFTADEVRRLIDAAGVQVKAMVLLGINCGFGNADCAGLTVAVLDLDGEMIDYPRPKTGIPRRCPVWPETVEALRSAIEARSEPQDEADAALVFITKYRESWGKHPTAITHEMKKLLKKLGIKGHRNFYTLRHTFRTIADAAKDQPAADFIMGHESLHMSSHYRETIDDDRLQAVSDHVRTWLYAEEPGEDTEAPAILPMNTAAQ
jgi:integrase